MKIKIARIMTSEGSIFLADDSGGNLESDYPIKSGAPTRMRENHMKKKPKPRKWLPSHVTVQKMVPSKKRYNRAKEKRIDIS